MEEFGLIAGLDLTRWGPAVARLMNDEALMMRTTEDMERAFERSIGPIGGTSAAVDTFSKSIDGATSEEMAFLRTQEELTTNMERVTNMVEQVASGFANMGQKLMQSSLGVSSLREAIFKLGGEAVSLQNVRATFERMGGDIEEFRRATQGLVASRDVMLNFNRAAMLVSRDFAEQLPQAMGYLQQAAMATGESMDYMMRSLVIGVGRLSPLILDNLGITLKLSDAYELYAKQTGLAADELTKTQQQVAAMNYVMAEFRKNFGDIGASTSLAALEAQRYRAQMEDLKVEIGESLIPVMNALYPAMQDVARAALQMFGTPEFKSSIRGAALTLTNILDTLRRINEQMPFISNILSFSILAAAFRKPIAAVWKFGEGLTSMILQVTTASVASAALISGAFVAGVSAMIAIWVLYQNFQAKQQEYQENTEGEILSRANTYAQYEREIAEVEAKRRSQIAKESIQGITEEERKRIEESWLEAKKREEMLIELRSKGLMKSEYEWRKLNGLVTEHTRELSTIPDIARKYGDSIEELKESYQRLALAEGEVLAASSTGWAETDALIDGVFEKMERQVDTARKFAKAIGVAVEFGPGPVDLEQTSYLPALEAMYKAADNAEQLEADHQQAMLEMQEEFQLERAESAWEYQNSRIQSEADYQARRAAAISYGNTEAVKSLDEAHSVELATLEQNNERRLLETERSEIAQQIAKQKSYIAQVEMAKTAAVAELGNQLIANKAFMSMTTEEQKAVLGIISEGDRRVIMQEVDTAKKRALIQKLLGMGLVQSATAIAQFQILSIQMQAAKGQAYLNKLESDYQKSVDAIQANIEATPFNIPDYAMKGSAAGAKASESATAKLKSVANDLNDAVKAAQSAIFKLVTFTVPESAKTGMARLREFMLYALEELYAVYKRFTKEYGKSALKKLSENMTYMKASIEVIEPVIDAIDAIINYEAALDLPQRVELFVYDLYYTLDQFGSAMLNIDKNFLKKVAKQVAPVAETFSVVQPIIDAMTAMLSYDSGNLDEILDVFESDMMMLLDRLGQIGERLTVEGMAKAQLFGAGAASISEAIASGMSLIQDTAGTMINMDYGGASAYVPLTVQPDMNRVVVASPASKTVSVSFGDVYLQSETDWARFETLIRQVVTDEV